MATQRLENYLRMYRKRVGLSQDEVASLLGAKFGTKTSRYERFTRIPTLEHALECEAIYGIPVKELFAGVSAKAERAVQRRADVLNKRYVAEGRSSPRVLQLLAEVASSQKQNSPT